MKTLLFLWLTTCLAAFAQVSFPTVSQLEADYKVNVRVASTANVTIATALNNGDTLDGVTLATGDRVLLKDQSTGSQNGIYVVAASPARAADSDSWPELPGAVVVVTAGTANAGKLFINTSAATGTLNSTAISYAEVSGSGGGALTSTQVGYGDGSDLLTGEAAFFYTAGSDLLTVPNLYATIAIELGHASANTLTASSGDLSIEGNVVYRAGGTDVPVTDGGTGRSTGTTAYALIATGTTATGAQQSLAAGATTEILVGGGASALPAWTTATGSGAPVRATSPTVDGLTLTGTNTLPPLQGSEGSPLHVIYSAIGSGTAYTLTASYATVDMGTTDPSITIAATGTYRIFANIQTTFAGSTWADHDQVTFKLRRTNNTAADLTDGERGESIPAHDTVTMLGPSVMIGPIEYTTSNADDVIVVQGDLNSTPSAGAITVTKCTIFAERIRQ